MKKFFHGITGLVRCLILLGVGATLLMISLLGDRLPGVGDRQGLLDIVALYRIPILAAGGGILILEFLHLLSRPRNGRVPEELSFRSKGGPVSVKTDALRDAIAGVAESFDAVESMESRITRNRGHVDLDLYVRVVAGTPIPVLCKDLQARAREVVAEEIGLFELRQVRVHIRDLLRSQTPPASPGAEGPPHREAAPAAPARDAEPPPSTEGSA